MSTDEKPQDVAVEPKPSIDTTNDVQMESPTEPSAPAPTVAPATRKRPRLDLASEPRERKRGKTMFGLLVGTLNKAKTEDKQRNATDAAKKRQLIEQRLQDKLKKETDSVRRAEEAKKEKQIANRKEEELQLKDSIHKLRRIRLPLLSNFLLTSDVIPTDNETSVANANPLAPPPRSRVAPLYYLPVILTPAQDAFLVKRKEEVKGAVEKEWESFRQERTAGIDEIAGLRKRVQEEEARKKLDSPEEEAKAPPPGPEERLKSETGAGGEEAKMEIDEPVATATPADKQGELTPPREQSQPVDSEKKDNSDPMQADEDDAVEY
jgi:hypothetical protein